MILFSFQQNHLSGLTMHPDIQILKSLCNKEKKGKKITHEHQSGYLSIVEWHYEQTGDSSVFVTLFLFLQRMERLRVWLDWFLRFLSSSCSIKKCFPIQLNYSVTFRRKQSDAKVKDSVPWKPSDLKCLNKLTTKNYRESFSQTDWLFISV